MSGPLGAKQLVVDRMHAIFSDENSVIFVSISFKLVTSSSPFIFGSIIKGMKP